MRGMSTVASRGAVSTPSSLRATGDDLLSAAEKRISRSRNIEHWQPGLARWDAEVLLAHVLDVEPDDDSLPEYEVSKSQRRQFKALVERRLTGEPVNYITGHFTFCGLRLTVRPGVFSPRTSSELVVEHAARRLRRRRGRRVAVDVATGSGAIALAIGAQVRGSEVWAVDISPKAVKLGRANARQLGLDNVAFAVSDMLLELPSNLRGEVDVFTIPPPYVARDEVHSLPVEVRKFEPHGTLTDGSDDGSATVAPIATNGFARSPASRDRRPRRDPRCGRDRQAECVALGP